jgi:Metal-dependent hydrolases of the beta-lactamase superfamily III
MLRFFGRGSAFADDHNCAYFVSGGDLVLLDCPMTALPSIKRKNLSEYDHIYILVTHTHGDHCGGVGMFIDYNYFVVKTPVTVVAPSKEVYNNLKYYLKNIEGCNDSWYTLVEVKNLKKDWFKEAIVTPHTEELAGKCFGFVLNIDGTNVVYTGDTGSLEPFEKHLTKGTYLYTEVSAYSSAVHIYCKDLKKKAAALTKKGVKVFLMHMDDEYEIAQVMKDTGAEFAPLEEN